MTNTRITDAMLEAAYDADIPDRIQGFKYGGRYVIRDLWKVPEKQEIWSAPNKWHSGEIEFIDKEYLAFQKQIKIERIRKMLEAALGTKA